ncbi:hypothetical protein CERZMDRAFT_100822 [Cercospora zeae-maydis SCOH1-5]|uniref:Xylanolytic transcriptional activator regulatory domain-containing protein n=1 Tax=Cercospora zeae-maydis SCOH1-5 TaxID=717836 RepID=A0A6A6F5I0_9PEZI|nr:hypothetical protein CERZMDRAFT_100822 [Cercospora zeae-maydis SCOH1-5]
MDCSRRSVSAGADAQTLEADASRPTAQPDEQDQQIESALQRDRMQEERTTPEMRTRTEPAETGTSAWFNNDHDRFEEARRAARRASIAEIYTAVNAHPVPGPSIYPSIEVDERRPDLPAASDPPSNRLSSAPMKTPSANSSRRASLHVAMLSDADIIAAEDFDHVPRLPAATYSRIAAFHDEQQLRLSTHAALPGIDALNAFVQLYFEYHHSKLPILHKATFIPSEEHWHLVLAVAAVGCEHSELCSIQLMAMFEHLAMRAISLTMTYSPKIESMSTTQSVLIFSHLLLYDGSQDHLLFLQHHRSLLVTTCRKLSAKRPALDVDGGTHSLDSAWRQWALLEQERRYVAAVWNFECLQYVTFDMPPTMDTGELTSAFPCHEHLWSCSTAEEWHRELEQGHTSQSSIASVISQGPVTSAIVNELSDAAFLQVLLTLLVAHKRLIETYAIWIRPRINADDRSDGSVIHKYLDADMERFEQNAHSRPRGDFEVSFHLMSIIRFTPFSDLCVASGLRPGRQIQSQAIHELTDILSGDETRARITLLYAGRLFSHFQTVRSVPRCDLQAFLAASLYIWAWVKLVVPGRDTSADESQRASPGESIRVDQGFESGKAQRWIARATGYRPQLAGVGVLSSPDAAARVLKEAARVLKAKAAASTLGRSMADQLVRIVLGG